MLRKIFIGLGLCFLCVGGFWVYDLLERQFRLSNIRWEELIDLPSSNADQLVLLESIFEKPFTYLDRGKQSFVFISYDKKYVLKFFDARAVQSPNYFFFSKENDDSLERKKERLFDGYRLAYDQDRENTGLLFVQLGASIKHKLQATVYDRFGFKHVIDLSEVPFVIQKKATPTRKLITSLLQKGNVASAKSYFRKIIDMYVEEYKRGICDLDHNFMYNTGFVDGKPIRIDVGRLCYDEKVKNDEVFSKDLEKIAIQRIGEWTKRHFPQYRQDILDDMRTKLNEISEF